MNASSRAVQLAWITRGNGCVGIDGTSALGCTRGKLLSRLDVLILYQVRPLSHSESHVRSACIVLVLLHPCCEVAEITRRRRIQALFFLCFLGRFLAVYFFVRFQFCFISTSCLSVGRFPGILEV